MSHRTCQVVCVRNFEETEMGGRLVLGNSYGGNMSKVKEALKYVEQGMNPHAAAVKAGAAPTHVYKALKVKRDKELGICSCCGQRLPEKQR